MSAAKPHRIAAGPRAGQCRDCGTYSPASAPASCCRCALQRYREDGFEIIINPIAQFVHVSDEMWRQVATDLQAGAIRSGRFYIYVGHNDGGPLTQPPGEDGFEAGGWVSPQAPAAQVIAEYLLQRYPQVWIVTTVGCWNAQPLKGAAT